MIRLKFSDLVKKNIFKDRDELFSLVPKDGIVGRVEEKNNIIMELSPLLLNSSTRGIFVQGNPGVGKTACIMEILNELSEELKNQKIKFKQVSVNCSENRKETTILLELLRKLNPDKKYPKSGWSKSRTIDEFYSYVKKNKDTVIIVVLDEVDFVLKNEGDDILYRLSRINSYLKSKVNVMYISNDEHISKYMKRKTISSLGRVKISFLPYGEEELKEILTSRVKNAFYKDVVSTSAINKISEVEASHDGDARKAISMIDSCGKILLTSNFKKIDLNIVNEAYKLIEMESQEDLIEKMNQHQRILYFTILKRGKKNFTLEELYDLYMNHCSKYDVISKSKRSVLFMTRKLALNEFIIFNKATKKVRLDIDQGLKKKMIKRVRDLI